MRHLFLIVITFLSLVASTYASVQVEIYTIPGCFGCGMAKSMFEERGIPYVEISLQGRRDLYRQMKERVYAQMKPDDRGSLDDSMSVPRIFINGTYIGGYGDLDANKLDKLSSQIKSGSSQKAAGSPQENAKNQES